MSARRRFCIRVMAVILSASLVLFVPYKSTASPKWEIVVVDANGKSIPGLPVRQEWSYFGIDIAPWVDSRQTDSQGRVEFPRRVIWASLAARLLNLKGASEKLGPSVWIEACDNHSMLGELFWEGHRFAPGGPFAQKARIVVKPSQHCFVY